MKKIGRLFCALFFMAVPVRAEDYHYAPKGCDFRIDFPTAPVEAKRCAPDDPARCNAITSYTHVFGIDSTVDFNVTCNPPEKEMYEHYSGEVMKSTLIAMVGKGKLDQFETGYREFPEAKQATILGTGKTGDSGKIYMAQLWIGHNSVFTVEGELIGAQTDEADKMFADILRSIRYKDWKPSTSTPPPADTKATTPTAKKDDAAPAAATPATETPAVTDAKKQTSD